MGKTRIGVAVVPETKDSPPEYGPQVVVTQPVQQPPSSDVESHKEADCWYVVSILSAFFCCCSFPLNIIGLVHSMIAKHERESNNTPSYQRRLHQTKCWTGWSIAIGTVCLILMLVTIGISVSCYQRGPGRRAHALGPQMRTKPGMYGRGRLDAVKASGDDYNSEFTDAITEMVEDMGDEDYDATSPEDDEWEDVDWEDDDWEDDEEESRDESSSSEEGHGNGWRNHHGGGRRGRPHGGRRPGYQKKK